MICLGEQSQFAVKDVFPWNQIIHISFGTNGGEQAERNVSAGVIGTGLSGKVGFGLLEGCSNPRNIRQLRIGKRSRIMPEE